MLRCLAVLALLATPAQSQMLDGADDPAFQAALATLLSADDPTAVAALRDLAEAGNPAALVTLPFALDWVPPQGNLQEKNAQRMVGGIKAQDAAAKAHGATALWDRGRTDTADDLPDRATGLATLGEHDRAAYLWSAWVNQTGGLGPQPDALFTDMPAWIGATALSFRMGLGRRVSFDDQDLLLGLIQSNSLAAWLAIAQLTGSWDKSLSDLGDPLAMAGIPPAEAEARLTLSRAVLAVTPIASRADPITPESASLARIALAGRAEFAPVERLCRLHCPDTRTTCEAAMLAYPGLPFGGFAFTQPFAVTLPPDVFYSAPRGLAALIRQRQDPTAVADRTTSEGMDTCYAGLLARRDQISFGP
jgi:hypothetical protein